MWRAWERNRARNEKEREGLGQTRLGRRPILQLLVVLNILFVEKV